MFQIRVRHHRAPAAPPDWVKGWMLFLATASIGATSSSGPTGKLLGVLGGGLLFVLVLYEIYLVMWPLYDEGDESLTIAIFIVLALYLVKTLALLVFPGFGVDVGSYQAWAMQIADLGPAHT